MFRFGSMKGSCSGDTRFWEKILPEGWRFFFKLARPCEAVKNTIIPLLRRNGHELPASCMRSIMETMGMSLENGSRSQTKPNCSTGSYSGIHGLFAF